MMDPRANAPASLSETRIERHHPLALYGIIAFMAMLLAVSLSSFFTPARAWADEQPASDSMTLLSTSVTLYEGEADFRNVASHDSIDFQFDIPTDAVVNLTSVADGPLDQSNGSLGIFILRDSHGVTLDSYNYRLSGTNLYGVYALPEGHYTLTFQNTTNSQVHTGALYLISDADVSGYQLAAPTVNIANAPTILLNQSVMGVFYNGTGEVEGFQQSAQTYRVDLNGSVPLSVRLGAYGEAYVVVCNSSSQPVQVSGNTLAGSTAGTAQSPDSVTIDCGTLPRGTYYIRVSTNDPNAWKSPYILATSNGLNAQLVQFKDIPSDAWYVEQGCLPYVVNNGIMTGYGNGLFGPDDPITRAQVATILYRAYTGEINPDNDVYSDFSDVEPGEYYSAAVKWAHENGIVLGIGDTGTFAPNDPITREQLAAMIARYVGFEQTGDASIPSANDIPLKSLNGYGSVSPWAYSSMAFCVDRGIITGAVVNGAAYVNPQDIATRAQMAKIITITLRDVIG